MYSGSNVFWVFHRGSFTCCPFAGWHQRIYKATLTCSSLLDSIAHTLDMEKMDTGLTNQNIDSDRAALGVQPPPKFPSTDTLERLVNVKSQRNT